MAKDTEELRKCVECLFDDGASYCARNREVNRFTGKITGVIDRGDTNWDGKCALFVPKPKCWLLKWWERLVK